MCYRFAPSPDPSMTIKLYDRTPKQQALLGYLVDVAQSGEGHEGVTSDGSDNGQSQIRREPHGAVGAVAGHRAIAQSNSAEIADALFHYSAPEEVTQFEPLNLRYFCRKLPIC